MKENPFLDGLRNPQRRTRLERAESRCPLVLWPACLGLLVLAGYAVARLL